MTEPVVIGVDGGGTKTVAWLAPLVDPSGGTIVGRGLAGPGNPRSAGFEVAQANIDAAIAAAFAEAKLPRTEVAAACFGLAGAGRSDEQEQIAAWATRRGVAGRIRVCHDAEPILAAASLDNRGIALIAGTGSLAWGRNEAGKTARSGGWGYLLGDEGSGYAIALAGLRLAAASADGRAPKTELLLRLQQQLAAATPEELIARVHAPEMNREGLAALASVVFAAAANGDELAGHVVERAAADLAAMVESIALRLGLAGATYPLALAGGVLLNQPALERALLSELARKDRGPSIVVRVNEPVLGAVRLARLTARGS